MSEDMITFPELKAEGVLLGRRQVDRLESIGDFPRRVALGQRRVAWLKSEVIDWVDQRIRSRSTAPGTLGSGPGRGPKRRVSSQS